MSEERLQELYSGAEAMYDPDVHTVYVNETLPEIRRDVAVYHELAHVIDDIVFACDLGIGEVGIQTLGLSIMAICDAVRKEGE